MRLLAEKVCVGCGRALSVAVSRAEPVRARSSPPAAILALIVDDGQRARKLRQKYFQPRLHLRGRAAVGPHARYRTVCSMDFAAGYIEAGAGLGSLVARN